MPTERTILTREGWCYFGVMVVLLVTGLYQQVNLILLVATLAAGPFLTSCIGSRAFLRRLSVVRRAPLTSSRAIRSSSITRSRTAGGGRRPWHSSWKTHSSRRTAPRRPGHLAPGLLSPGRRHGRARTRWQGTSPRRGAYRFRDLTLGTRAPFGLIERRVTILLDDELVVYPRIGQLTRRWFQLQRQASENRMGKRHDRSSQQEEYHGLRDYRSGDSPRWIHWRTSARRGELMVKEFEQQNEQELAMLIDPWLPRTKVAAELREAMEQAISFAATVCLESCRRPGRRLVLGWTGATPGICQGQASVKLLHELLQQLAVLRPATEGTLAELIDALPAPSLRDSLLIIVSTRPLQLAEEAERSKRLAGTSARTLLARAIVLNAAQGELTELIQDAGSSSRNLLEQRVSSADQERLTSQEQRRRGLTSADDGKGRREKLPDLSASLYVMLTVSTVILSVDATDSRLDWFLPMITAAAGIVAFLTVDQGPRWGLPRDLANFLALGTLGLLYLEYKVDQNQFIAASGTG